MNPFCALTKWKIKNRVEQKNKHSAESREEKENEISEKNQWKEISFYVLKRMDSNNGVDALRKKMMLMVKPWLND